MKTVLKLVAAMAVVAAAAYAVVTYWETLVNLFYVAVGKIKEKKAQMECACASEDADFVDIVE